ncbi:DUF58 domain-containing protein [Saccharopolyspora griseoalba]|uniref:DUF58 domain-containing protein n=1 Tax=Saccharopolyspora griseoalba TaxID=1431848 RepID=A0ABW2LG92_9PSEU
MLSGLTIRGRCLLAAGAAAGICALVLDERDLLRVSAFVIALPLLALLLAGRVRFGIAARRHLDPPRIPVGSTADAALHLTGGGLPVEGLVVEDEVPHALGDRARFRLNALRGNGIRLDYSVTPALRGVHHIGPLRTWIGDPFGLATYERELAGRSRLVATPNVHELSGLPPGSGMGNGENGTAKMRAGHGNDDAMVREYRHGDDIRRVHWKSTARRDDLMVRVEEKPWQGGVTVLLDRRSAAHRGTGAGSSVEWAISAVASICLHLSKQGTQIRLLTEDGWPLTRDVEVLGDGQEDALLDSLAAVRPSPQRDLSCSRDPGEGHELIAVLGETTTAAVAELTRLRPPESRSLAVLLDVRAWNGEGSGRDVVRSAAQLRAAGWAVTVAEGPQARVPEVWQRLCGQVPEVTR